MNLNFLLGAVQVLGGERQQILKEGTVLGSGTATGPGTQLSTFPLGLVEDRSARDSGTSVMGLGDGMVIPCRNQRLDGLAHL